MKFKVNSKIKELTGTKKREICLYTTTKECTNSYWDGGSRSEYEVFNMNTGRRFMPPTGTYPWTTTNEYMLQPGDILIETGTLCGKSRTPNLCCRPDEEALVKAWLCLIDA